MRFLSADLIFPIASSAVTGHVLAIHENGKIDELINSSEIDNAQIEKFNGALVPGFINTHCHLELSHLKNKFAEKTGLGEFLLNVTKFREHEQEIIQQGIIDAEKEMIDNGIVAVGDISNTTDSFHQKSKRNLYYHSFIELLSLNPDNAASAFQQGKEILNQAKSFGLHGSLAPHAPYTVSPGLLELISNDCFEIGLPTTIHMLESNDENEFYLQGTGFYRKLYRELNVPINYFEPTRKTSLESVLPSINKQIKTLLVHNTIATQWDVEWAEDLNQNLFWCLCPNANLFIEDRMPDIPMLMEHVQYLTIGTDSLSSNHELSVLAELQTIQNKFPEIKTEDLLRWGTYYGAKFLGIDESFGSFDKGKIPGVVLLEGIDLNDLSLKNCKARRISS